MKTLSKNKVVLGLSGGVDSTTAALLLKEKGLQVIGFYFDPLGGNIEGLKAAESVANQLEIEFIHKDVSEAFSNCVINNFCNEYINGRTPNPCVICNPNIKFKELISVANENGAYYIATGHYSRIIEQNGNYYIRRGTSEKKDQSYMLCRLGQDVLSRLIFPLGEIEDKEVTRQIARDKNLSNADAADSQEICFIDEKTTNYVNYIKDKGYDVKTGNFIDSEGNILGEHKGLINYTIGQRKGLGITFGKPVFVTKLDPINNTITLGENNDLFDTTVYSVDNFFVETGENKLPDYYSDGLEVLAKIRYAAKPSEAYIYRENDGTLKTVFKEAQRAATPGQTIVFYKDDLVIGGGFIK